MPHGGSLHFAVMKPTRPKIEVCLEALARERGMGKTFCPSEAARRLSPDDWRSWMPKVREAAVRLVAKGKLGCTQRGQEVDPAKARGALRFSLPHAEKADERV